MKNSKLGIHLHYDLLGLPPYDCRGRWEGVRGPYLQITVCAVSKQEGSQEKGCWVRPHWLVGTLGFLWDISSDVYEEYIYRATSAQQKPSPHRSPDVNHNPFTLKVKNRSPDGKNGEMSFLIIKPCLVLQNSNRNKFLRPLVNN